jgi:nucleotide-binding universal stress UspA family protein
MTIERIQMVNVLKPIIAGVDATKDGAWAGAVAWRVAEKAGAQCILVYAARDLMIPPGGIPGLADMSQVRNTILRMARERVLEGLRGNVPEESLDAVEVRIGAAPRVLVEVAAERDAGLIVVGGKKHRALGRWMGGSTAHQTVRIANVPVMITTDTASLIERVLAAVDLSPAAAPTIEVAQRYARLFDAELRVMHSIEDVPFAIEYPALVDPDALTARVSEVLESSVWPKITCAGAERVVRHGAARVTIETEVNRWGAHLVVVGSHGKGWVDRFLIGSVTQRLITALPSSLLIVPVSDEASSS